MGPFDQAGATVRLEWGPVGAAVLAPDAAACVVVDVLSFTTSVGVALERGSAVHPYPWHDERATAYADAVGAVLAVGRRERQGDQISLSPASIRESPAPARLVLPSPNGSSICAALREAGGSTDVLAGSLRNRTAVAAALREVIAEGGAIALVPAGERWPDGSLRPAVEDLWGVGAVAAELEDAGAGLLSPEAVMAAAAWRVVADDVVGALHACSSGRELDTGGFAADVDVAGELDSSLVVPWLGEDGAFGLGPH